MRQRATQRPPEDEHDETRTVERVRARGAVHVWITLVVPRDTKDALGFGLEALRGAGPALRGLLAAGGAGCAARAGRALRRRVADACGATPSTPLQARAVVRTIVASRGKVGRDVGRL